MAWVYLDDQFPDHPKVVLAGGDAAWLFVCGLAYCRRYSTGGEIPAAQVARLTDRRQPAKLAAKLVEVGLWEVDGDRYQVHDYSEWNRSEKSRSEAGRKAARARWDTQRNANASESHSERIESADASGCTTPNPNPMHVHPPQTQGGGDGSGGGIIHEAMADARRRALALAQEGAEPIRSPDKWLAWHERTHEPDWPDKAAGFLADYPDLSVGQLADCLLGRTSLLSSMRRREATG